MTDTEIEWTHRPGTRGKTWNPVRGCSKVSAGCTNCYAERTAARGAHGAYKGLVTIGRGAPRWTGEVKLVPELLDLPLRTRAPTTWFVNSMSDLFHEKLSPDDIDRVFAAMLNARVRGHQFLVLTKRAERMQRLLSSTMSDGEAFADSYRHVWLGVSVEDQKAADERIPHLLATPAAVRFLSVEPLLGPVDLTRLVDDEVGARWNALAATPAIDWVIVGGESGPGARPCDVAWIRSVVEQCKAAGVPCFVKQLGAVSIARSVNDYDEDIGRLWDAHHGWPPPRFPWHVPLTSRKGGDPDEWPADLRVREWPEVRS